MADKNNGIDWQWVNLALLGLVLLVVVLLVAISRDYETTRQTTRPRPSTGSTSRSNPDGLDCSAYRVAGRAAIKAVTVNPVIEKDMCWTSPPHGVYEAFVKTRSGSGGAAHWKITFNTYDARSGVYELCQDARTGAWECSRP